MDRKLVEYEERIYPTIYPTIERDYASPKLHTEEDMMSKEIKRSRVQEFTNEKKKLEDLLLHYKKIKKRWTKADSTLKIVGLTLGGITGLSATIIGSLATLGATSAILITSIPMVITSGVLGGFSGLNVFLSETVSIGITSKKKKIYREICEKLEHGISKLYLYQVKALSDDVLTLEEIEESVKIVKEIKDTISQLKGKDANGEAQEIREAKANLQEQKKLLKESLKKLGK